MANRVERNREVWPNEAQDFTPWLAANLGELSDALDLELERPRTEVPVGPYFLDLFAMDARSGRGVAVENQLDQADHSHLGQLLTYAVGLGAHILVWIASDFTPEHLRVVDQINNWSPGETEAYAVIVEGKPSGRSRAPTARFFVVSAPTSKERMLSQPPNSGREGKYLKFFRALAPALGANGLVPANNSKVPSAYDYERFFLAGYRDEVLSYNASIEKGEVRAYLFLHSGEEAVRRSMFQSLKAESESIRRALSLRGDVSGFRFKDFKTQGVYRCLVGVATPGSINDRESATAAEEWLAFWLPELQRVLEPTLRRLLRDTEQLR